MNPIVCDTNVFIKLFTGDAIVITELEKIGNHRILMPSVSMMERFCGMGNKLELQQMKKKIKHFNVLHLNEAASQKAIEILSEYRLSHGLSIPDALIGAMALAYNLELYTYNLKDFRFLKGIRLYSLP